MQHSKGFREVATMLTCQQLTASLLAVALVSGCSTSATITLRNGTHTSGRIVRSDSETVFVEKDDALWSIERDDIEDVSHPGIGEVAAGTALLGLAAFLLMAETGADDRHQGEPCPTDCRTSGSSLGYGVVAAVSGVTGLSIAAFGLGAYYGSRSNYALPDKSAPRSPAQEAKGIRLGFEF
jgi:transcriptional antiterminator Rof (Rho-off)